MRDRNSGSRSLGVWLAAGLFLALAFTAGAASGGDNAAYVSYSGVPSAMHPGDTATVTVTMRNTGTTTWKTTVETETDGSTLTTTRTTYSLDALGHGWDVSGVAVSGSVAPNATHSFEFTITAPETTTKRDYVFRWQMARDEVVTERPIHARSPGTFGAATDSLTIQVGPDMAPSFGSATIKNQEWTKGVRITPVVLPGATGGNGPLSYALTCSLPNGVRFTPSSKTISGRPGRLWPETTCTWKVTDADDNTSAGDADTLEFTIEVGPPDTAPEFSGPVADQKWLTGQPIPPVTLPGATGGNGTLSYALTCSLPEGVTRAGKRISGTPRTAFGPTPCTWKVTDSDANTSASDSDTETFTIEVELDTAPVFNGPVNDLVLIEGQAMSAVLTDASGGNGALHYSLSPPPAGLTFNSSTRTLSGRPTRTQNARTYTYKVTDSDGNTAASDADTLTFTIEVVADTAPEFNGPVNDLVLIEGQAMSAVLTDASGGNGALHYSLSPPPAGLTFNSSTRTLSGRPTRTQNARTYTYKVTDSDGNTAASDADTLTFTIEVVADTAPEFNGPVNDLVLIEGQAMSAVLTDASGGNGALHYSLSPPPAGLTFNSSTRTLSGRPTRTQNARTYTYKVTDSDANTAASDADTLTFTIEVVADTAPEFNGPVNDLVLIEGQAMSAVLTDASGGNGALHYSLSPPPAGLTFNSSTRTLSGRPTGTQNARRYTYKVTDSDANTAASDADTLTFTIEVVADTAPEFNGTVNDLVLIEGQAMSAVLTDASGGNGALHYSLSPPPAGLTFNSSTRTLSGRPTRTQNARTYTYKVTDSDANTAASDADTLTFTIEVVADTAPVFNGTVNDLVLIEGQAMSAVLTDASGGNGALHYSLSPPPAGLTFNSSTRTLSGRPTRTQNARTYTYKVTDSDANTAASDADTLTFTIEVVADTAPEFNGPVNDLVLIEGQAMSAVLTDASGGNGALHYSLSPPPTGLTFNSSTRTLSGRPTRTQNARTYTYKVTDSDGNTSASDADTETFTIEVVPPDTAPVFSRTVNDMTLIEGQAMSAVLTDASGGNGALTYSLSPSPPDGVTFSASTRELSGTPTAPQSATTYTYTVADSDGNTAAGDSDTLEFTIAVAEADTAPVFSGPVGAQEWVSGTAIAPFELPEATGGNGDLTYALSPSPPDGVTFSASTRELSGTPTATQSATTYTYTVTDSDGNTAASDSDTERFTIAVAEADTAPVFSGPVGAQEWVKDTAISPFELPEAEGGNGDLTYALSPSPPDGVTFNASTRELSGTPTATQAAVEYTYTVTDADGNTAPSDADTLEFTIAVVAPDTAPVFSGTADDLEWVKDTAIASVVLPEATGGNGALSYALSPSPPDGVTFSASTRELSGTPTATQSETTYTYTVTDADGNTAAGDSDTLEFTIAVAEADTAPSFRSEMIEDLILTRNQAMAAATLPEATGGNGGLTYSLTGDLPAGVVFDASTRTLSGTPTERQAALEYTYTATDSDGDAASLSFTIEVAGMGSADAAFVSYTNVPSTMTAGSTATVTVRMRNTGATTWTSADGYALGSRRPQDNVTWGLSRVSLPAAVAPNGTVDFMFEITAPAAVQRHKFSWRMVRGASDWFGDKTEVRDITVEADESLSFGASTILGQTWVKDVAIDALTLPAATGGTGELAYTLTGTLPAGVTFDASTRTLSGTPTRRQEATEYRYTATDSDGDAASLLFTIEVAGRASDDASFASYTGVPSTMAAGSSATVTVRMQNTGTTTWTSAAGYQLGSQRPQDNVTWGLSRVSLPSDVAPNATVDFTFEITAPETVRGHNFRWRMLRGTDGWFGDKTELREIAVEANESPSFDGSTIPAQTWVKAVAIDALTLPAATGGNGDLTYALAGDLPAGVTFDASTRTLSGTPAKKQAATGYTYTATDLDGDAVSLVFTIEVAGRARDDASFVSYTGVPSRMAAGSSATVTVRMQNTGTTTWTSADGYQLGSQRPQDNVTWGLSRVSLPSAVAPNGTVDFTFAITAPARVKGHNFRWRMLRGADGWFGDKTELVAIEVEDPSFGDATISDQTWARAAPIDALTLPEASGSGGVLTYTLTPSLPDGLTFTAATRTVSGTPTTVQAATEYTYTATDIDGDAATLTFAIAIEEAETDDASFVSVSGAPSKMAAGGSATVTVTMQNTGTTTWTSSAGYGLGSQSPQDNVTWGLSRVSLPADVAPNESAAFTFTITAPETTGIHTFAWQMVRDPGAWFGSGTGDVTIEVEDPSFGDATIPDQTWVQDTAIDALTLPAASGGDGALTYALTPSLPDGLTFTESTRTLSGTPTAVQGATEYTYTATDAGGDAATLAFAIAIEAAEMDDASFVSVSGAPSKMAAGGTAAVTVTMTNTGTTTWTSSAGYGLGSQSPQDNDTWGLIRASLSGSVAPNETVAFTFTITAPETTGAYTFAWRMVRETVAWFGSGTGDVTITVEDPSFGDATISDQTWVQNTAIAALTLHAASGGDGGLTYGLTPSLPAGVSFNATTRVLSGRPTTLQAATEYTYTATDADGDAATLSFAITVTQQSSSTSSSATALPPAAPTGLFDMFEYWLLPRGSALTVQARLRDGRIAPAEGSFEVRSFWRGDLWGRNVALLGDPSGERYDIFEEVEDGLDYWGTFEGVAGGDEARPSVSLDRPFRWMNRFMAVGDAVESSVTGRLLSNRRRNQESGLEATMRLEIVSHRASFTVPEVDGLTFEDVLEVRFWPDVERAEAHDTFYLARGFSAVYSRRSAVAAPGGVVEWWAVEKALTPVAPSAPSVPWFDPFSPGWPKTAVLNGNLDDFANGVEGGQVRSSEAPAWTADSGDAVIAQPPSGLDAGSWSMLFLGSDGGGDSAPDAAITEEWIPVEGGTYQLSACMRRESVGDNVLVDFNDGIGRDADFADAHLVAVSTGTWECRAVTKCIPGSVGAVRIRAARDGANLGDAWFDRIELKRIAACAE